MALVELSRSDSSIAIPAAKLLALTAIANKVENSIGQFSHQSPIRIMDTAIGVLPDAARDSDISGAVHGGVIYLFRCRLHNNGGAIIS